MTDDTRAPHDDPADHGVRRDQAGTSAGSVSSGGIVAPAQSGGSGDRGQDGTENETGPGPQTDWLRDAPGEGDYGHSDTSPRHGAADPPRDEHADATRRVTLDDHEERTTLGAVPEPDEPPGDRS
jgi:hypothetical protein